MNVNAKRSLPQIDGRTYLTDGGFETTLIFREGWNLPIGEAFVLLESEKGRKAIRDYFDRYLPMAVKHGTGFILESPTWRANPDWAAKLGYTREALAEVNRKAIDLMLELRENFETPRSPMPISGNIGPRGDGYVPANMMSAPEAEDYHAEQIGVFRHTAADLVSAFTLNYANEAIGVARAAKAAGLPVVISFTVETDGRLPSGQTLKDAIIEVDGETGAAPAYYMINCAHPTHFADALATGGIWMRRLRGLRANASKRSHAELETMTELDVGDPEEFGRHYAELRRKFRHINVLGG